MEPLSQQEVFEKAWKVLSQVGWTHFSWSQVKQAYPALSLQLLASYFPTPKDLIIYFMETLVPAPSKWPHLKDTLFEALMTRLEALVPYRTVVIDLTLFTPLEVKLHMIKTLHTLFCPLFPYDGYLRDIQALVLAGLYLTALAHWINTDLEKAMITIDQGLSRLIPFFNLTCAKDPLC